MKQRIQEAMRRRHRKGDEGFTLIELLVVILIIAILAAVGIVALLSALSSGKKSAAKTTLRNAVTAVKSVQTGDGVTDFSTVDEAALTAAEPDITFSTGATTSTNNAVGILVETDDQVVLHTVDPSDNCFFVELNAESGTRYSASSPAGGACVVTGLTWNTNQTTGWQTP